MLRKPAARYIGTLLSRQEGLNYRNELLHGSVDEVGEVNTALLLMAAIYFAVAVRRGARGERCRASRRSSPSRSQLDRSGSVYSRVVTCRGPKKRTCPLSGADAPAYSLLQVHQISTARIHSL